jgi:hypothetical protein
MLEGGEGEGEVGEAGQRVEVGEEVIRAEEELEMQVNEEEDQYA